MVKGFSLRSCVTGVAIVAVAVAVRAALDQAYPHTPPFVTLFPAVALAGLLCGPWVGAVSGLIGMAVAIYLWIPPRLSFAMPGPGDRIAILLFAATSSIVLWAAAVLRARLDAVSVARDALDLGLESGGVGIWEINLRNRRITASGAAYALHLLPDPTRRTLPEDWLRHVHPDDVSLARTALLAAVEHGTMASYTYRILGAPDGPRWIAARGKVVGAGGERRLLCALVDVTEQVRVQDELRRERERLRLALQAGSLAVWDYHPLTRELTIDTSYAVTMGFAPNVTITSREQIRQTIHPDDQARVAAEHEAIVAGSTDYRIEYRVVTPGGAIRWVVSQGLFVRDDRVPDQGRLVGIIQDITERKRREDELQALAATREMLIREADHRIKNSLQLVTSLLGMQLRGVEDPEAAEALRGAITRVGAIAASHLALQGSEDLRRVDLGITLRDLCAHFAQLHPAIEIDCRACGAHLLEADRAIPLALVVNEALTNALRHAFPDGQAGRVVVSAATEGDQLVVRVRDDGVGMRMQTGETGLGSRIIRSLAERLAAKIDVESAARRGTLVAIRLSVPHVAPIVQEAEARV
jgi:two-component sensor histidine kinase/PAS domain-containing protein